MRDSFYGSTSVGESTEAAHVLPARHDETGWDELARRLRRAVAASTVALLALVGVAACKRISWQAISLSSKASVDAFPELSIFYIADVHVEPFFDPHGINVLNSECRRTECIPAGSCVANFTDPASYDYMPLIGCDPPLTLLESALEHMDSIDSAPDMIIFAGDSVAHYVDNVNVADAIQRAVFARFARRFPSTPLLFALGNNDLMPDGIICQDEINRIWKVMGDPQTTTVMAIGAGIKQSSVVSAASGGSSSGRRKLKHHKDKHDEKTQKDDKKSKKSAPEATAPPLTLFAAEARSTFLTGGYYGYRDAFKRLRVLCLNSLLFVSNYDNKLGSDVAAGQLRWFADQLAQAESSGDKVIVVGHNPPGMFLRKNDWNPPYLAEYLKACQTYSSTIMAQLFGHHSKEMIRSLSPDVAALVTVGMTPAGGHGVKTAFGKYREAVNPGFAHLTFGDGYLKELTSHHADLSSFMFFGGTSGTALAANWVPKGGGGSALAALKHAWREMYNFTTEYEVPDVTPASVRLVQEKIQTNSRFAARYGGLMRGFYSSDVQPVCDTNVLDLSADEVCFARRCKFDTSHACWDAATIAASGCSSP